jgi:hypothetical protein
MSGYRIDLALFLHMTPPEIFLELNVMEQCIIVQQMPRKGVYIVRNSLKVGAGRLNVFGAETGGRTLQLKWKELIRK